jgi:hypothetical protein
MFNLNFKVMKRKLSVLKLSKNEQKMILGGCNFRCNDSNCPSCSGPGYAFSTGQEYNRQNGNVSRN